MIRNGLFLSSIGFLIILYSVNPTTYKYDLLNMTTGFFLAAIGGYIAYKGIKKEKKADRVKKHGNR